MIKKISLALSLTLFCFLSKSQVKIADQPGNAYYNLVKEQCRNKLPKQAELLAMRPVMIPTTFMDTLRKYDWVELGGYGYHDKEYYDYFSEDLFTNEDESQYQFNIFRLMPGGEKADFSLHKFKTDDSYITTTSFSKSTCSTYDKLKVYKFNTFLQTSFYGEISYSHIVSFKNGVLVIDVTKTGKLIDPKIMYRNVYKAIPRKFTWGF